MLHPRIVVGVPSGITDVERRSVREAAEQTEAREVHIIEESMAACNRSRASNTRARRECDCWYFRKKYNLLIGENTAEIVKIQIGSVFAMSEELSIEVSGRDQVTGLPKTITVTSVEIRTALSQPIKTIVDVIQNSLEETPLAISAD